MSTAQEIIGKEHDWRLHPAGFTEEKQFGYEITVRRSGLVELQTVTELYLPYETSISLDEWVGFLQKLANRGYKMRVSMIDPAQPRIAAVITRDVPSTGEDHLATTVKTIKTVIEWTRQRMLSDIKKGASLIRQRDQKTA